MQASRFWKVILVEEQFHEAVFTHASTSPNLQIIASLDVARRQMELEGYELVNRAIQLALDVRREVNSHPLVSKYFRVLGADEMIPGEFRNSGFVDYLVPGTNWATAVKALRDDEFALDVTRLTLVCGSAGFDGTQFKNMLAADYDIQLNKTSRNSVLLQTNINNTRSDAAHLISVLARIAAEVDGKRSGATAEDDAAFGSRVRDLIESAEFRAHQLELRGGEDALGAARRRLHNAELGVDRRERGRIFGVGREGLLGREHQRGSARPSKGAGRLGLGRQPNHRAAASPSSMSVSLAAALSCSTTLR